MAPGPYAEVLTGDALSRCYGLPLAVDQLAAGRFSARFAPPPQARRFAPVPQQEPVQRAV